MHPPLHPAGAGKTGRIRVRTMFITAPNRACELGAFFDPSQGPVRVKAQQILKHGDQTFAVGVQEAEVAGASEAFGQHMLEDQPQEPGAGDCSVFAALRFAVPVAKGR